ncbi:MAG: metallophosphoesterase, partial [Acetobacteraceae bacterium]|nr:metallophosphoesterase [Acetobacteraceae bacterium]
MQTILQITDAHLSPRNELFRGNIARIYDLAVASPPDLTVASGDLSLDGADHEADMAFAA